MYGSVALTEALSGSGKFWALGSGRSSRWFNEGWGWPGVGLVMLSLSLQVSPTLLHAILASVREFMGRRVSAVYILTLIECLAIKNKIFVM